MKSKKKENRNIYANQLSSSSIGCKGNMQMKRTKGKGAGAREREREWKKHTYNLTLAVTDVAQSFIPASKGGHFREYFHSLLLIV